MLPTYIVPHLPGMPSLNFNKQKMEKGIKTYLENQLDPFELA
jgi:hypothetical protein